MEKQYRKLNVIKRIDDPVIDDFVDVVDVFEGFDDVEAWECAYKLNERNDGFVYEPVYITSEGEEVSIHVMLC